ncbi:hypothetical protein Ndes2437B_g00712 [Nannochloris sp. 'desiccata']
MSSAIAACSILQVVVPSASRSRNPSPFSAASQRPFTSAIPHCRQHQIFPARLAASQSDQQEIENLDRNYCDDFICTSSPAVEMTVRSLANDLIRANGVWTRSLFSSTVLEYKGFRSFKGRDGYKSLNFVSKYVESPVVTVKKLKMLDGATAQLDWRLQGSIKSLSVDIDMTTIITMNLLTGQVETHIDKWDLYRCSLPAAAAFNLAKNAFALKTGSADAAQTTNSILDSLTSVDDDGAPKRAQPTCLDFLGRPFRSTDNNEVGSYPHGSSSVIESESWRSGLSRNSASVAASGQTIAPTRSLPKSASYVKVEGFEAPGGETATTGTSPPLSPGKDTNRAPSLLSRQLSVDNLSTLARPIPASPALASLAERLEAQVQAESAVKPASVQSRTAEVTKKPDNTLLKQLQGQFAVFSEPLVIQAFSIARAAHQLHADNPRGEAAFARCAGAAVILAELGADEVAVAGALLHDALDRTMFSEPQLRDMLRNDEAFELVQRVSHMGYICQKYRSASNSTALKNTAKDPSAAAGEFGVASHLVGMLVAHGPPRALLVRLAVALQEARAVGTASAGIPRPSWGSHAVASDRAARRHRIAAEGLEVWAPLANRLGVWSLKAELEDRAFRTLRPAEYAELRDRLEAVQEPTKLVALVDALRAQLQEVGVEYLDLSGRPKHLWGVFKKMETKGYSADHVRDVRGLRVIVKTREDCYLALRAVEKAWGMVGESKNYIKAPKANGYQSLHAVADPGDGHLVEIQIRTDKMHYLAEYGAEAAHWKYKERAVASSAAAPSIAAIAGSAKDGGVGIGAAREANWAKFMTSQHVLLDKKCRPSGSPDGDQSLASILASMDGAVGGSSPEVENPTVGAPASGNANAAPGTSPGSSKGRTFQEYIAASGQRPTPPEEQRSLVAVVAGSAFSVAELPAGTTVGQLLKYCGAEGGAGAPLSRSSLHVVVNRHVETEYSTVLQAGDVVELYADTSTTPAPASGNVMAVGSLSKKLKNADLNRAN